MRAKKRLKGEKLIRGVVISRYCLKSEEQKYPKARYGAIRHRWQDSKKKT